MGSRACSLHRDADGATPGLGRQARYAAMACAQHRRGRPRGRAQKALHVTINDYQRTDGSAFRSNDHDATVPGGLDIQAVVGLDTYAQAATTNVRTYNGV